MIVRYSHIAEYVVADETGKLSVMGILDNIACESLPFRYPRLYFVVGFEFEPEDVGKIVAFAIRLVDPGDVVLWEQAGEINLVDLGKNTGLNWVHAEQGQKFDGTGKHRLEVLVNGSPFDSTVLDIRMKDGKQ